MNRHLKVSGVFNPFLPDRLDALSVEGIGNFTLDLNELTVAGGLIDCSPALSEANEETMATIQELRWARSALTKEITRIGKLLADTRFLLIVQGSRLIDSSAIRAKAERIARKLPKVAHGIGKCAIQSYGETERINYLPFGKEVRIFSLPNKYNLAALFLNALADALADRGCHGILLTAVFTGEIVGIYLPHNGVCYLTDAPDGLREKELALSRFLLPFTAEQRRGYRRLSASADAIEWHLCERISEYRALVSREEELLSRFHNESRLQNFRKRLLIDLFCSKL
ncbi:MAG: hypothetical protein J6R82_04075 [Clostridia bacterium]|nr:hypothetical protein [Clostridia bacterium]